MRHFATFVLLFAVWMLWSGHTEPMLVGLGLGSCALVLWISARLRLVDEESYPFHLAFQLLGYIPWVIWQVILTNITAARLFLHPKLPIHTHLVHIPVRQRTTLGQVIHANTITITPGTVTLDVRNNEFLVHALTLEAAEEDGSGELDRRVAKLEGQKPSEFPPRKGPNQKSESSGKTNAKES